MGRFLGLRTDAFVSSLRGSVVCPGVLVVMFGAVEQGEELIDGGGDGKAKSKAECQRASRRSRVATVGRLARWQKAKRNANVRVVQQLRRVTVCAK